MPSSEGADAVSHAKDRLCPGERCSADTQAPQTPCAHRAWMGTRIQKIINSYQQDRAPPQLPNGRLGVRKERANKVWTALDSKMFI